MGIKKGGDGLWTVWYGKRCPVNGQAVTFRRTKIKSEKEARRIERELVLLVEQKLKRVVVPIWRDFLVKFLQYAEGSGISKNYHYSMTTCLAAATQKWNDRFIDEIAPDDVRDIIKRDYGDKSISHQRTIHKFMKQAFNYAFDCNFINRTPVPHLKFKTGDKIKRVLTPVQLRTLLDETKRQNWFWYPHYVVASYAGLRNGEIYALRWSKVDFERRQILVNESWNNKDGYKETKSGDDRIVEIAPNLLIVLKELRLQTFDTGFVLPRHRHWDKGEQARELGKFLDSIGLPKIRFHDLRATWATILLSSGVPAVKVMKVGGWKDLETMQIYIRKAGVDIKGTSDGLNLHDPVQKTAEIVPISVQNC